MPFVNIKVLKGVLTKEQKQEMIARVSAVVAEIEARPFPKEKLIPGTTVIIDEVKFDNWGAGGRTVTPEMFKAFLESE
jgi:4-oxalocrotonate tautomerase family enzyme